MEERSYSEKLAEEAAFWGRVAADQAGAVPPEWSAHRRLRHNLVDVAGQVDALLDRVRPGMRTLELGCGPGWLTIALARRGAIAHGIDIAPEAIKVGRARVEAIAHEVKGRATYEVADLNHLVLGAEQYDLVVAKGILHHLTGLEALIGEVHRALVPGGLFWICDNDGTEATRTALLAGLLLGILPTEVSYATKLRGLVRARTAALDRLRASIEAEGLSPFEGAGRAVDWPALVEGRFDVESRRSGPAVTGYLAGQLKAPDWIALPFLRALGTIDRALVRVRLLHSTGVVIYARKSASDAGP
jgi:2-polyprenyl-3-methyl-5-hydroxy-6-metoxy-1,4-benzoquinol methylase